MTNDVDLQTLPELGDDAVLQGLISTFNARVIHAETEAAYIGTLSTRVKLDDPEGDTHLTLPSIRLVVACSKAELERARATQVAHYLIGLGKESATELWHRIAAGEGRAFMAAVKRDVEYKRKHGEMA